MKTLTIKDLVLTQELDRNAMSAVHGGMSTTSVYDCTPYLPSTYSPSWKSDSSVEATQQLFQQQQNATGNCSAVFGGSISAQNSQFGQNNVVV